MFIVSSIFSQEEDILEGNIGSDIGVQDEIEAVEDVEDVEEEDFLKSIFEERNEETSVLETEDLIREMALIHQLDFVFGVTPTYLANPYSKLSEGNFTSAVSPIVVPIYIGLTIPNHTFVSFHPTLKFFWNYNLIYDDMVLPAEIENRTMQSFYFLLTLPVMFKINFFDKNSLGFSTGVSTLIRFSSLAKGVNKNEAGFYGSVEQDLDYANDWYWKNLRFLYLYAGVDWMFYKGRVKYGPEVSFYLPMSIFTDKSALNFIMSIGLKVQL